MELKLAEENENNPPLWFLIAGIIIIALAAYFVMMAPAMPYTPDNQYYLKDAQSKIIYNGNIKPANFT
jgi:hypothetical protein